MTRLLLQASARLQSAIPENPALQALHLNTYHPATVLFVDMIGFTQFCAENDPDTVGQVLREFLTLLSNQVASNGGRVEKFLGDGLMAFFDGSNLRSRDATNSLRCALAMTDVIATWNRRRGRIHDAGIQIAIGIHTGRVIVGAIGNDDRREIAVFGDTVNIASRVEGKCRCLDSAVLVTSQVKEKLCQEGSSDVLNGFINFDFQELRGRAGYVFLHGLPRLSKRPNAPAAYRKSP